MIDVEDVAGDAAYVRIGRFGEAEIRDERPQDWPARESLLDETFGAARHLKTSERLREGRLPAADLALSACDAERLVGTLRLWPVAAADRPALWLGPLAVAASHRSCGLGAGLMAESLYRAMILGYRAVLLVGDPGYYERFGFEARLACNLVLPGPVEPERFLARELVHGALAGAAGAVYPTGRFDASLRAKPEARLQAA
jgi:predicted N-acetyltransferase YhbS